MSMLTLIDAGVILEHVRHRQASKQKGNTVTVSMNSVPTTDQPPVLVIGAGLIGLAAVATASSGC